jgi:hypothetical protein
LKIIFQALEKILLAITTPFNHPLE